MVRGRVGLALNELRRLWEAGTVSSLSDARLLERFASDRDEFAFDALMARHGPLVWSVCRSILSDPHDVEDAFQATFLVLVRKAHSLRVGDSLCGWLYRVSYRVAQEARVQRERRRVRERAVADGVATAEETERARDELLGALSQEINRLPEKYRLPIVLCGLEGMTRKQAASQLGWPPGTVATRLARGQDLLRQRMRRRVGDDAGGLSGWLGGLASSSVPAACRAATVRAALRLAKKGWFAAGLNSSAVTLARGVHRALFWTSVRSFLLVAVGLAVVTWVTLRSFRDGSGQSLPPSDHNRSAVLPRDDGDQPGLQKSDPAMLAADGDRVNYAGRVLDPTGKPVGGASVYLDLPRTKVRFHKLAISGADGRFRATVSRREITKSWSPDSWRFAKVVATAPGYGPVWEWTPVPPRPNTPPSDDLSFRLAWDDIPIDGRILTAEGRAVVGARILASALSYSQNAAGEQIPLGSPESAGGGGDMIVGSLVAEATTDADGRFRMTGLGRDRVVSLWLSGPEVAEQEIKVQTRKVPPAKEEIPGRMVNGLPPTRPIYGATFVHIAEPGRSLEGIVREQGTAKPIVGALVNLIPTDRQGRFRIDGLPRSFDYQLDVSGPAGTPYFFRRLTVASRGAGLEPVSTEVELSRGVVVRGRLSDRLTGRPIRGRVLYAPLKNNPNAVDLRGELANIKTSDEEGNFAVTGVPGRGVLRVTAGTDDVVLYPRLSGVTSEDRKRGFALLDDELALDALPRPVSLMGSHAYKVIDIPEGRRDFEMDFPMALRPGRTVAVRVVDPLGVSLNGVTAFGCRAPTSDGSGCIRGDGSFAVRDLDPAWPRRVVFLHPERDLAGFRDLKGDESADVTTRLSPCGSIVGRVVDRAGMPIAGAHFSLVYDDAQGIPHIAFPAGRWVPTYEEAKRDQRTRAIVEPRDGATINETSSEDGRFQIRHVVPGVRYHLGIVINRAARRLGLKAPQNEGRKRVHEQALSAGQVLDLGDVRILPEELRRNR
jgi:RNA polymerase sigma factor (sigma-70 family)